MRRHAARVALRVSGSAALAHPISHLLGLVLNTGKTLKRTNGLITDAMRRPFTGIGKPEPLRENLSGFWLRRIDDVNRLVYAVDGDELATVSCRYHYE
jgi:toxin YoeB